MELYNITRTKKVQKHNFQKHKIQSKFAIKQDIKIILFSKILVIC